MLDARSVISAGSGSTRLPHARHHTINPTPALEAFASVIGGPLYLIADAA